MNIFCRLKIKGNVRGGDQRKCRHYIIELEPICRLGDVSPPSTCTTFFLRCFQFKSLMTTYPTFLLLLPSLWVERSEPFIIYLIIHAGQSHALLICVAVSCHIFSFSSYLFHSFLAFISFFMLPILILDLKLRNFRISIRSPLPTSIQ